MLTAAPPFSGTCGPLALTISAGDDELACVARSYLALFSRPWNRQTRRVDVRIARCEPVSRARGTFISCAHMTVDRDGSEYFADTQYGFNARGVCSERGDSWTVTVPPGTVFGECETGDMEDIFSLISTVGWRNEGYLAIHAGAVLKGETCAMLCATSGGGKSTLTAALVLNGWSTLGDDKLLLRCENGVPVLRSLLQTFNLDPASRRWFDLGDLDALPRYSAWTEKRRVHLNMLRPGASAAAAQPTHIVSVTRNAGTRSVTWSAMNPAQTASALLKQIVLPDDIEVGRWTLKKATAMLPFVRGINLEVGNDVYSSSTWLQRVEEALR